MSDTKTHNLIFRARAGTSFPHCRRHAELPVYVVCGASSLPREHDPVWRVRPVLVLPAVVAVAPLDGHDGVAEGPGVGRIDARAAADVRRGRRQAEDQVSGECHANTLGNPKSQLMMAVLLLD